MERGKLLVLEGGESCGKTTVLQILLDYLNSKGVKFENYREPGGIAASETIRNTIFQYDLDPKTEALLFAASRRELMSKKIVPALESGTHIILDRFLMSSLCYQGYTHGVGIQEVYEINKFAIDEYLPDMNIFLSIQPEKALARLSKDASREVNRFDTKELDFHNKVFEGYHELAKMFSSTFAVINADQTIEKVSSDVIKVVNNVLGLD